jgi:hypothetical protein
MYFAAEEELPPPPPVEMDAGVSHLATAELPASTELLAYYRTRLQEFENERNEFIERTASIEVRQHTLLLILALLLFLLLSEPAFSLILFLFFLVFAPSFFNSLHVIIKLTRTRTGFLSQYLSFYRSRTRSSIELLGSFEYATKRLQSCSVH